MSYIFYLLGTLGVLMAGYVIVNGASPSAGALGMTVAITYGGSIFVASMTFFAIGRALDYLAVIAKNSQYHRHLEHLDPDLAAEIEQERVVRAEKKARGFFGLGGKKEPIAP